MRWCWSARFPGCLWVKAGPLWSLAAHSRAHTGSESPATRHPVVHVPSASFLRLQNFHTVDDRVFLDGVSTSLGALKVKNMPAVRETWVQSLCREDPSEKEMATLSSILAWRIPGTEEPGGLQCTGSARGRHDSKQGAGEGTNGPCCWRRKSVRNQKGL